MIELYSGTPGSGKSYHACDRIYCLLKSPIHHNIIANFPIIPPKNINGYFEYCDNENLTIEYLVEFAKKHHTTHKEKQTTIVIDEAGVKFNSRNWRDKDRLKWLDFFSQHRKLGYDIILISQADIMLDKQIRQFIEINHTHRKMAYNGKMGFIMSPLFTFVDVKTWYAMNLKLGCDFIRYSKKIANIYDSFALFNNDEMAVENG